MTTPIPPGMRAEFDRELAEAVRGLTTKAAEYDGMDVIEANVEMSNWLMASPMDQFMLAASTAALAIRLHRGGSGA